MRRPVSAQAFGFALVTGAALLAFWIIARYGEFGPKSVFRALVHTGIACVLLKLLPFAVDAIKESGVPAGGYIIVFGVALPLLVYAFLGGGWTTRAAIGLLR